MTKKKKEGKMILVDWCSYHICCLKLCVEDSNIKTKMIISESARETVIGEKESTKREDGV